MCRYAYNPLCVIPNLRIFGKSTGIFLCVCLCVCVCVCAPVCTCVCWGHACVCVLISQSCLTLCNPLDCSLPGSSVRGDSPGKNTGVGCHVLLQGIFPTQVPNPGLLHCKWILYHLSHQGRPKILEWVAYPFSRGSSQPRDRTQVSCIASGFFTN